ncbi:MAG: NAD-binding protein, partial [Calditrichia bacterium]|nr:NAD-binding protein [Calditrichia bacterium]
ISIGMFINVPFLFAHLTEVIVITFLIIVVKSIIILLIFLISKHPLNQGFITAFSLAHIGEFSFILLNLVQEHKLFDQNIHQLLLSSIFLSMLSIPFALTAGKKISQYKSFKKKIETSSKIDSLINHTIIAGFGINGQNIARILKLLSIPYSILEINPSTIEKYKSLGEPIYFGDIDRKDNLKIIGISKASLLVIAISDMEACKRAIKLSKSLNPGLKIIVRSNYLAQVETMYKMGADLVLSQDMETSLMFINHILKFYNMPDHIARVQTNILRKEHYSFFYKKESREAWKIAIFDFIEQDNELFFIGQYSRFVNKEIISLAPYNYNDMKIIGVIRKNMVLTDFSQVIIVEKFDTIIFSGNHKIVAEAMAWMEENN